jgi:hypothetical protein
VTENNLALSDADFLKQPVPTDVLVGQEADTTVPESTHSDTPINQTTSESEDSDTDTEQNDSEAQEQTDATSTEKEVTDPVEDTQQAAEPFASSDATESLDTSKKDSTDTKEDTQDTTEFDYKSAFEKVSQPFKANGVDMQVKDPEDIIRLMQMGANYQKKMAQLKPNLKMIKMLDNNGLLDESKLHNLIDLSKKDPQAIAKLIKESGIDPLDVDLDTPTDYKPTDYTVSDKEYQLDQVLEEIKGTETFTRTIDTLTKQWDTTSKTIISDNPEIISVINSHMGNGVFDKVNSVMQQEKALGKLVGVSDIEAYRQITEHLQKTGVLADQSQSKSASKPVSSKSDNSQADAERDKKRKAVAPVKNAPVKKAKDEENFLGLSDEEFMKKHAVR